MKKGFTLLELIIVTIIVGVLATLGFNQYTKVIERSRGAEAKAILGDMRKLAASYYLQFGNLTGMANSTVGLDQGIPTNCTPTTHYFSYSQSNGGATPTITAVATRCGSGGKNPAAPTGFAGNTINLTSDLSGGSDTWAGNGGY